MTFNSANYIGNELYESFLSRSKIGLETSMGGSNLTFNSVQLLYYKCHKVYRFSWIKNKKTTINPKTEDDKCFQYAATFALNYGEIGPHPERVWNIKPFINIFRME